MSYDSKLDLGQTQPISFRPELQHIRNGLFGKDVLPMVRRWLASLDTDLTGSIATSAQLGNHSLYHNAGENYENTEFAGELIRSRVFIDSGVLPKTVIDEYIRTIADLCSQTGNPNTYNLSIAEAINGYGILSRRINDGILVAEAKMKIPDLRSGLTTAIVANDEKTLVRLLWNEEQEKSVKTRVMRRATDLDLPDEEAFLPLYDKIMRATLRKEINYLLAQREYL